MNVEKTLSKKTPMKASDFQLEIPQTKCGTFLRQCFTVFIYMLLFKVYNFIKPQSWGIQAHFYRLYLTPRASCSTPFNIWWIDPRIRSLCFRDKELNHSSFPAKHEPLCFVTHLYNSLLFCFTFKGFTLLDCA